MLTIKSLQDLINLKTYNITPICYVYYKKSLLDSYYVGFTTQNIYKYLRHHHKMKSIIDRLNEGFYIQIYTKYDESALITLLKPKLNIIDGNGILGRKIYKNIYPKNIGEIISIQQNKYYKIKKNPNNNNHNNNSLFPLCETMWDELFINKNNYVSLNYNLITYLIKINLSKPENKNYYELFNNIYKENENDYSKEKTNIFIKGICLILKYCKINSLFPSCILIYQSYIKNTEVLKINDMGYKQQITLEICKNIHYEIIKELKNNNYLISYNYLINILKDLSYLYRYAIKEHYIEYFNDLND